MSLIFFCFTHLKISRQKSHDLWKKISRTELIKKSYCFNSHQCRTKNIERKKVCWPLLDIIKFSLIADRAIIAAIKRKWQLFILAYITETVKHVATYLSVSLVIMWARRKIDELTQLVLRDDPMIVLKKNGVLYSQGEIFLSKWKMMPFL